MARNMLSNYPLDMPKYSPPETLIKSFSLELEDESGKVTEIFITGNNYQRFFSLNANAKARAIRLNIIKTRQQGASLIFAFDIA